MIDEPSETHVASDFGTASGEQIAMSQPAFDRANGVVHKTCTSSNLLWRRAHSWRPGFHDTCVPPAREPTMFLLASAGRFSPTPLASSGGGLAAVSSLFHWLEANGPGLTSRSVIALMLCRIGKRVFPTPPAFALGRGVRCGARRANPARPRFSQARGRTSTPPQRFRPPARFL
jgi:hypothetical protein